MKSLITSQSTSLINSTAAILSRTFCRCSWLTRAFPRPAAGWKLLPPESHHTHGPNLQHILRQSYDNAKVTIDL